MSSKQNILLLVTLVAILGCGNAASRHHTRSRPYSDSLEREFELIESGDDENNEPEPEVSNESTTGCRAASKKNTDEYID
ncbi:hypothetical protein AVEN_119410-1, partial [Araneus ventricosus]